jgi:hypothetical protein
MNLIISLSLNKKKHIDQGKTSITIDGTMKLTISNSLPENISKVHPLFLPEPDLTRLG